MIRIAIKMLVGDRTKYLGLVFGISFACFLITVLMGMFNGMLARTYALIDDTGQADVWVMDSAVEYVEEIAPLPETAVDRVRSVRGIAWAVPLYTGTLRTRLDDGRFRSVQVIGVDAATLIGLPPRLRGVSPDALRAEDSVFVDSTATEKLLRRGVRSDGRRLDVGDDLRINDHRALIAGFCDVSPRFMPKATVYTTYSRALQFAPPERRLLSFVLVRVANKAEAQSVARSIESATGYRARTAAEFREDTLRYYIENTDLVAHIGLMVLLGMVVGLAVVALLLSMFTQENKKYYAALKAMGTSDHTLVFMLLTQGLLCGVVGFGLGTGGACLLGTVSEGAGIPFLMSWMIPASTSSCVAVICLVSIGLNVRPLITVEPAIVFKA